MVWDATLEDYKIGYASTIAPLVVKDKVIVGVAGGEYGIRALHRRLRCADRQARVALLHDSRPGEPGNDTWAGDSWKTGGASVWVTGAYDAEQNLLLYGIGNPGPDYHSDSRKGDNLYSNSLVALDADTGKLKWHYQFTPHDVHDWDATEVPILADLPIGGQTRKVVMFANRNGFYYTLDRTNGKLIVAKPFVMTTWAKEIGADGRPVLLPGHAPDEKGEVTCPGSRRRHQLLAAEFRSVDAHVLRQRARSLHDLLSRGSPNTSRASDLPAAPGSACPRRESPACGALRAIDPATGERKWEFKFLSPSTSGMLTTASGLLFSGDADGNLLALDSRSGKLLWRYQMGATLHGTSPTTYMIDGRQHLLVPSGTTLTAWAIDR